MKNVSRHATRGVIVFIALLFIATALLPLYQVWQDHQTKKQQADNVPAAVKEALMKNKTQLQGQPLAGFTPVTSVGTLQKIDTTPGNGAAAKSGDTVTVDYTGAVAATGIVFQSSKDSGQPASLSLRQVIPGWSQGIPGMKIGGTRRLLIPASLAYGPTPPANSGIPPNADLVFDVTLYKIGQ